MRRLYPVPPFTAPTASFVLFLRLLVLLPLAWLPSSGAGAVQFRVATYNLRNDNATDTEAGNGWATRLPLIVDMVTKYGFDVFGTQEGKGNQIDQLQNALPGFGHFGLSRDGNFTGEHSTIFYRKARFDLLRNGDFWLSATPSVMSVGWDAALVRIATWGCFRDRETSLRFWLINAHYDHIGTTARIESSKLVLKKIAELAGSEPVMFMGDLNSDQTTEAYLVLSQSPLLEDAFTVAATRLSTNVPSFNGWSTVPTGTTRIDHIFLSSHFTVDTHRIATDLYNGRLPSDHYPVIADVRQLGDVPRIVEHPASLTVAEGGTAVFSVEVSGAPSSYQWSRNGTALAGATGATLSLPGLESSHAGDYAVTVTNAWGTATSRPAKLLVAEPKEGGLVNLSVRNGVGTASRACIAGFVVGGNTPRRLLVRGVGPALSSFGVSGPLADPVLVLFDQKGVEVARNDDWLAEGNAANMRTTAAAIGAFALPEPGKDAALLLTLPAGVYSAVLTGAGGATGEGLVELYEVR